MAYTPATLFCIAQGIGSGGPRLWHYTTSDALATVVGASYFSDAIAKGMRAGDLVDCIIANVRKPTHVSAVSATAATVVVAAIT